MGGVGDWDLGRVEVVTPRTPTTRPLSIRVSVGATSTSVVPRSYLRSSLDRPSPTPLVFGVLE